MARSMARGRRTRSASGVSASAKSRAAAGPVVSSLVRSESRQAIRTRNGSCHCAATWARAVTFQEGASRRRRRMAWPIFTSRRAGGRGGGGGGWGGRSSGAGGQGGEQRARLAHVLHGPVRQVGRRPLVEHRLQLPPG